MTTEVRHDPAAGRWEAVVDGAVAGTLDYQIDGPTVVMTSTHTDPAQRGKGIAAIVTKAALDEARAQGATVVPACSYVADYIARHPGYADLLA